MKKDITLRTSFNKEARLYHEIRPRYPETLFDALVKFTNLQYNAQLLEIGPGTGQATDSLAKRGYKITAIELGADLAEVAREALKKYPNVEVMTGAFEDVMFPSESFDLVYAATAFHWITPDVRFSKPYNILKVNGHLAIIHTNHISDEVGDEFFFASQPIYKKYKLDNRSDDFRLPGSDELGPEEADTNLFTPIFFKAFPLTLSYSADEYSRLISTYSPIIIMTSKMRGEFLKDITNLIDEEFGGSIIKHFAFTLTIAKKNI